MQSFNSEQLSEEQKDRITSMMREWKTTVRPALRPTEYLNNHDLIHTPSILGDEVSVAYYLYGADTLEENTTAALFLNNNLLEMMGLDSVEGVEALREQAYQNMAEELSCERLSDILGLPFGDDRIMVLSNAEKHLGAAAIEVIDRKTPDNIRDMSFYMLPSSIHEVLIVPADEFDAETLETFNHMVRSVNECEVSPDEQLSDHAYMFDRNAGLIKDFDNGITL